MFLNQHLERAILLLKQRRYAEAEKEIKVSLSQHPQDALALRLLAECFLEQKRIAEAEAVIKDALVAAPDDDGVLYDYARVMVEKDDLVSAEKFLKEAILINPSDATYFGFLANIYFSQKDFDKALEKSEEGLTIDASNLLCLNIRSSALIKLNRKEEAFSTIDRALEQDPENEFTHTNYGWQHLEKGNHQKALEHFREALRLNPEYEFAKAGMVEALKARYLFYRLFLKYAFWISNMKSGMQWGIILGGYFLSRFLNNIAANNEALSPFLTPIIYLYSLFAFSTWVIVPLSNLFLRLNVYGRFALKPKEITTSNFVGVSLAVAIFGFVGNLFDESQRFLSMFVVGLGMMIPLSSMLSSEKPTNRLILLSGAIGVGILGLLGIIVAFRDNEGFNQFTMYFLYGVIIYQFVANAFRND
jgi:tetratricopeptide (TPR) repeat protein